MPVKYKTGEIVTNKIGRLSNKEKKYIRENADKQTVEEIAKHLSRNTESITTEIRRIRASIIKTQDDKETRAVLKISLKQSSIWLQLKNELEPNEMGYFEERYLLLMHQFKDDVSATEENQIFKAIKYEIMLNRNASLQKRYNQELSDYEQELIIERKKKNSNKTDILSLRIKEILELKNKMTIEYTKLDEKHQNLLEDLKATRKQRMEKYENSKTSFLDIIKSLDDKETAEKEGRESLLMKKAMEKDYVRLGQPYTYADKIIDRPVLNSDTVFMEEDDE